MGFHILRYLKPGANEQGDRLYMPVINTSTEKGFRKTDIIFLFLFCCAALFSWWLAPYGWTGSDEAFYIVEPYRFVQGDGFFVDDWNCGQLFAFLLIPLMKLHLSLFPSTDGIILYFRYYYVVVSALFAAIIYFRGRRISAPGALFSALFFMLYSPLSVRNFSYNAMGLMCLSTACIVAVTIDRHPFRDMYLAGILLAALVLCCPFAVGIYIIYSLFVFVLYLCEGKWKKTKSIFPCFAFTGRAWLTLTMGCGTMFIIFCIFVLSRNGLGDVVRFFPRLFMDPEHKMPSVIWLIKNLVYCTITSSKTALRTLLLCGIIALAIMLDRKRLAHRKVYLFLAGLMTVLYCMPFVNNNLVNELMLPINILGLAAYFLAEKPQKSIFRLTFVPGLIYAVCMHHSSSLRYLALCNGFALCSLASAFFIVNIVSELAAEYNISKKKLSLVMCLLFAVFLPAQLLLQLNGRCTSFFHDTDFSTLDTKIEQGVQKGLITSEEHAEDYLSLLEDTEFIRNAEGEYVLYVADTVWLPLGDAKLSANNSLWTNYDKPEPSAKMLREYLLAHPQKRPEYIYVTKTLTYTYQDDIDGMVIVDIINIENRPVTETETGYVIKMN